MKRKEKLQVKDGMHKERKKEITWMISYSSGSLPQTIGGIRQGGGVGWGVVNRHMPNFRIKIFALN